MALSSLAAYGDSDSEQSDQEETCAQKQTKELMTVRRTKETSKRAGTVQITIPQISKVSQSLKIAMVIGYSVLDHISSLLL